MPRRTIARVGCLLVLASCKGTEPFVAVPTAITVTPGTASFTALGATRQFAAIVLDQRGDTIPNATAQWATLNALVATVDSNGLLTVQGVGTTQVQASISLTSTTLTSTASVTVTQVPRRLVKVSGDQQVDTVAGTLQDPSSFGSRTRSPIPSPGFRSRSR